MAITALRKYNSKGYDAEVSQIYLTLIQIAEGGVRVPLKLHYQITINYARESYVYYATSTGAHLSESDASTLAADVKTAITKYVAIKSFGQRSAGLPPELVITAENRMCGSVYARRNGTSEHWVVEVEEYTPTYTAFAYTVPAEE